MAIHCDRICAQRGWGGDVWGLFTCFVLYDQRISMWTCLIGLTATLLMGLLDNGQLLFVYVFWIALSRTLRRHR